MKARFLFFLIVSMLFSFTGCFESYLPAQEEIENQFLQFQDDYREAANAAFSYEGERYFSTTDLSKPEDFEGEGVYMGDMQDNITLIESEPLYKIFTSCNVYSMHTSSTPSLNVCEFNCAGSGSVYSGVYYTSGDSPLCLMDFTVELKKNGDGYITNMGGWSYYYTEKITDNFYYYEARR